MRIAFLLHHFKSGGTEKVYLDLLDFLSSRGHECHLILFQKKGVLLGEVPESVKVYDMMTSIEGMFDFYKIFKLSRKVSELIDTLNVDILYSGLWINNIVNVMSCDTANNNIKSVISDHINTYASIFYEIKYKFLIPLKIYLTRKFYNKADCCLCVSLDGRRDLISICGESMEHKTSVIYNGIDIDSILRKSNEDVDDIVGEYIVSVGRISKQKGYEYLIDSYFKSGLHFKNIKLVIVGEDATTENKITKKLKKIAEKKGIADFVIFLGYKKNPFKYMKKAKFFVLSSLYEGFGLVLAEAMSLGCPVIATKCKTGPSEILDSKNGHCLEYTEYGILVAPRNAKLMAIAMASLDNDYILKHYKASGNARITSMFLKNRMLKGYEDKFIEILNQ